MTDMVKARLQAAEAEGNVAREANTRNSHRIDALMAVHGSGGRSSTTFSRDLHRNIEHTQIRTPRLLHASHVARFPADRGVCRLEAKTSSSPAALHPEAMGASPLGGAFSWSGRLSRAGKPRAGKKQACKGCAGRGQAPRGARVGRARSATNDLRQQRHQQHGPC